MSVRPSTARLRLGRTSSSTMSSWKTASGSNVSLSRTTQSVNVGSALMVSVSVDLQTTLDSPGATCCENPHKTEIKTINSPIQSLSGDNRDVAIDRAAQCAADPAYVIRRAGGPAAPGAPRQSGNSSMKQGLRQCKELYAPAHFARRRGTIVCWQTAGTARQFGHHRGLQGPCIRPFFDQ